MNNVTEIVALLRQQAELEFRILAGAPMPSPPSANGNRRADGSSRTPKPSAQYWRPPARSNDRLTPSRSGMSLLVVGPTNSAMAMRVALRHFLLDRECDLYRLPSAALDRMLQSPTRHRLPRLAGQRVRSAEVAVEMMNGRPLRVVRSVFNMVTFKSDGTLVPPLRDRHVRAHAELALALGAPARHAGIAEASTRFVARGGQWTPSAAVVRRIEQAALGRQKCPRISPSRR